jgi:hypothetical protein
MKKKSKRRTRRKPNEAVEFISLPRNPVITVKEGLSVLLAQGRSHNKSFDTEAAFAAFLPMIIDRANRKLHQHGLHLIMHEKGALLCHRADGKTPGTNKEKLQRAKKR